MMKKKESSTSLNQGVAGKYVKRDTPPVLRSKYYRECVFVLNNLNFNIIDNP